MYGLLDISTSGLVAQRTQIDTISANIANSRTTRRADGEPGPYLRRVALLAPGDAKGGAGVHVEAIREDVNVLPRLVHDPSHPDANADGYVAYPNIDSSTEMINAMVAVRAYEANVTAMEATKSMMAASLRLLA
ncbi:MAG: flagellar basal body rod protein FlgC [Planctomycetia bacterium]|jgi:flagellar basal-body rod protein FlgC|nr:flagellar basal body rod protein FlgC [Planctomycetia bacterium]MCC7314905.1 flagellar basal body rod protein FlgC [Planctomycetota bacterium]OQZ06989.1 MAG: flagellar basal body rod protein FlgC [Planctomycetes bacterium UTPLA1]OWY72460.1 flagellar basal body rod protein FlgC [cyanobacterium TDX16]